jgi:flagellar motor switch protein FliN/FliY
MADPDPNVKPAELAELTPGATGTPPGNIELVRDIPVTLTVELGRAQMLIQDILELTPGKVLELDRLAGEPLDIVVNGKLLARGEVVVVDENFGVRLTAIIEPGQREAAIAGDGAASPPAAPAAKK